MNGFSFVNQTLRYQSQKSFANFSNIDDIVLKADFINRPMPDETR